MTEVRLGALGRDRKLVAAGPAARAAARLPTSSIEAPPRPVARGIAFPARMPS